MVTTNQNSVSTSVINGWSVEQRPDLMTIVRRQFGRTVSGSWGAWGSVYETELVASTPYPITFNSEPAVYVADITAGFAYWIRYGGDPTKSKSPAVLAIRPVATTGGSFAIELMAIGRAPKITS